MSHAWTTVSIGDLCKSGDAELQTGPFGSQLHSYDYLPDGVPVVPTEAIGNGRLDHSVLPKISMEKAASLGRHVLMPGDILFARRGVQATGKAAMIRGHESGFICGTGAIRLRVKAKSGKLDPVYLACLLNDQASIDWFKFHAIGATMPNLNEGIIKAFTFALPPLPEQRAIAATLGALDDKIELNRKMNATLEAMARALFRDWFVDFGPTRAKMAGHAPTLAHELWCLFPDLLDDEGKPNGWEVSTIGEEVRVAGGSTPSTKDAEFWDGGINWATPKDLSNLAAPVLLETSRTISQAGLAKISSGLLPVGALLLSSRAPIGYLAIAEVPVAINQGFIGMICDKRISNVFAWLWTLENMDAILAKANGSTFQEISKGNFRPLPVVVPSEPVLRAFDAIAKPLHERIAKNERESRTLAQTRDLLLPRLMSGQILVQPDAMAG